MKIKVSNLIEIDKNEVLRYLEYKNQKIDENLNSIIDDCIKITKKNKPSIYFGGLFYIKRENK